MVEGPVKYCVSRTLINFDKGGSFKATFLKEVKN